MHGGDRKVLGTDDSMSYMADTSVVALRCNQIINFFKDPTPSSTVAAEANFYSSQITFYAVKKYLPVLKALARPRSCDKFAEKIRNAMMSVAFCT